MPREFAKLNKSNKDKKLRLFYKQKVAGVKPPKILKVKVPKLKVPKKKIAKANVVVSEGFHKQLWKG